MFLTSPAAIISGRRGVMGGLPGVPGDLVGADQGRVAVGLVGREFVAAGVVDVEVLGDVAAPGGTGHAADVVLVEAGEHAHAAEHVGGGGNDARPHRALAFEAVERAGIVVEALLQELQLLALHHGVAVGDGIELGALREMAGVAADAERGLLMHAGDAVEGAAAARGVGEPGVARAHDVVHRGAHGFTRVGVGRRVVDAGAELEFGVVGAHADVVDARLAEHAGGELIAGQRLDFVGLGDRVLAVGELFELAAGFAEDGDVHREVVAVHQFDLEEDELGGRGIEGEAVPVIAGGGGDHFAAGGAGEGQVLEFVAGCGDELAEGDGQGVLPAVIGSGGQGRAIDLQVEFGGGCGGGRDAEFARRRWGGRRRRGRGRRHAGSWRRARGCLR